MAWVRVDDQMPEHPKVDRVGHLAAWLNVAGLCHCNRNLTDGFISEQVMPRLTTIPQPWKHAERLVAEGLWERADGGFVVHDYHKYQKSADDIRKEREASRVRQSRFRNAPRNGVTNGVTNGVSHGVNSRSPRPRPTNTVVENSLPPRTRRSVTETEEAPRMSKDELTRILSIARAKVRADQGQSDIDPDQTA